MSSIDDETHEERQKRFAELDACIVGDERLAKFVDQPGAACDQDVQVMAKELLARRAESAGSLKRLPPRVRDELVLSDEDEDERLP